MKDFSAPRRVQLQGEYDFSRKAEIQKLFESLSADRPAEIDLSAVSYVDSTFLNELAMLRVRFAEQPIRLVGANTHLKRLLALMSFQRLFEIA